MERLEEQKTDQKDSALAPLLETEVCSDFGFIEAALKCLHTVYKFCNRIQYLCAGAGDERTSCSVTLRHAVPCTKYA